MTEFVKFLTEAGVPEKVAKQGAKIASWRINVAVHLWPIGVALIVILSIMVATISIIQKKKKK